MTRETKFSNIEDGPGDPKDLGNKIWEIAQKFIAWALIASVSFLVFDRNANWALTREVDRKLEIHVVDGQRRHALIDEEFKRADTESKTRHELQERDISHIIRDIDNLSDSVAQCQLDTQRILQIISGLPPEKWQEMILRHEKEIEVLKSKIVK